MPESTESRVDIHSDDFLRHLMRRQLRLSVLCAAAFVVALLGLPLANRFAPELMARPVGGFPLSWLILGVLFFPFVWAIAWIFIRRSIRLEKEEIQSARAPSDSTAGSRH